MDYPKLNKVESPINNCCFNYDLLLEEKQQIS